MQKTPIKKQKHEHFNIYLGLKWKNTKKNDQKHLHIYLLTKQKKIYVCNMSYNASLRNSQAEQFAFFFVVHNYDQMVCAQPKGI